MNAEGQMTNNWMSREAGPSLNVNLNPAEWGNSPGKPLVTSPSGLQFPVRQIRGIKRPSLRVDQNSFDAALFLVKAEFPSRDSLKSRVSELQERASDENWDGEGAAPLEQATVNHAAEFVDCLPAMFPLPDVEVSPHGTIDFEWVISREAMLSVSMCPDNTIAFAARFPGERARGSAVWSQAMPENLRVAFKSLRKAHDVAHP